MIIVIVSTLVKKSFSGGNLNDAWKMVENLDVPFREGCGYIFVEFNGKEYLRIPSAQVGVSEHTVFFFETYYESEKDPLPRRLPSGAVEYRDEKGQLCRDVTGNYCPPGYVATVRGPFIKVPYPH